MALTFFQNFTYALTVKFQKNTEPIQIEQHEDNESDSSQRPHDVDGRMTRPRFQVIGIVK